MDKKITITISTLVLVLFILVVFFGVRLCTREPINPIKQENVRLQKDADAHLKTISELSNKITFLTITYNKLAQKDSIFGTTIIRQSTAIITLKNKLALAEANINGLPIDSVRAIISHEEPYDVLNSIAVSDYAKKIIPALDSEVIVLTASNYVKEEMIKNMQSRLNLKDTIIVNYQKTVFDKDGIIAGKNVIIKQLKTQRAYMIGGIIVAVGIIVKSLL